MPILLTQKDTLPSETSSELTTLKATKALIIGGTASVSSAVENALIAKGLQTTRLAGATHEQVVLTIAVEVNQQHGIADFEIGCDFLHAETRKDSVGL